MFLLKFMRHKILISYLLAGILLYFVLLGIVLVINIFFGAFYLNLQNSLQLFCYCLLTSILVGIPVHFFNLDNNWVSKIELSIIVAVLFYLFINRNVEVGFQGRWVLDVIIGIVMGGLLFSAQVIVKKYFTDKF